LELQNLQAHLIVLWSSNIILIISLFDFVFSEVKVGETYNGILSANQGNYIHIEFKIPTGSPKPSLVGARLVNKNHRFASGTVPAKLGREDNMYRIVIDLGEPVKFSSL